MRRCNAVTRAPFLPSGVHAAVRSTVNNGCSLDYPYPSLPAFFFNFFSSPGRVCAEARTTQLAHKLNAHQRLHTRLRGTRKQALGDDTWRWLLSGKSHALLLCKAAENTQFAPKKVGAPTPSVGRRARSQKGVKCVTRLTRCTSSWDYP